MNLKLMRLKSGEDIVVELLDGKESQQHITVKNPAMLVPMGDGRNNMQMGLMGEDQIYSTDYSLRNWLTNNSQFVMQFYTDIGDLNNETK